MDLSRWSKNDYHITFFASLMLRLGANPYRCAYCRVNFVSFRKRKERYVPRRRKQRSAVSEEGKVGFASPENKKGSK
jgi:hypothetical protein